jgi:hypothetical protein
MTETCSNEFEYSEFLDWKASSATQRVYAYLQKMRAFYTARLLQAPLTELGDVGKLIGVINAIDDFLAIDFIDLTQREEA